MKIGIYTIHTAYNYGAVFQAYATQKALVKLGYDAEFVNVYSKDDEKVNEHKVFSFKLKPFLTYIYARLNPKVQLKFKRFRDFHSQMNLSKRYYSLDEIYDNPPNYDIHLVGSDQVWNLERGFSEKPYYFLDFLKNNEIKMSYASSFGTDKINSKYNVQLKLFLSSFKSIAVREDDGVAIIKKATGLNATQVLDPTFLLNAEEWSTLDKRKALVKGDYIFCYGFDGSVRSREMISSIRKRMNLPIIVVSVSLFFPIKSNKFLQEAGPEEFINLIKNAKFVCSSSYHGIAFAIHFRKNFFTTIHPSRNSRMASMLNQFRLIKRQLEKPIDILEMTDEELQIDYSSLENQIAVATKNSKAWLQSHLELNYDI